MCTVLVQAWINMNLWIAHTCKNDFYNVPGTCIWDLIPVLSQKDVQVEMEDKIWEYTRNDWNHIPCTGIQFRNCRSLVKVYIYYLMTVKLNFLLQSYVVWNFIVKNSLIRNFFTAHIHLPEPLFCISYLHPSVFYQINCLILIFNTFDIESWKKIVKLK